MLSEAPIAPHHPLGAQSDRKQRQDRYHVGSARPSTEARSAESGVALGWAAFTFLEGPDGCDQRLLPTPMLRATSSKRYALSDSYHSVIESKNSCFRSSACAARGDNLVTRCCGNVPATN